MDVDAFLNLAVDGGTGLGREAQVIQAEDELACICGILGVNPYRTVGAASAKVYPGFLAEGDLYVGAVGLYRIVSLIGVGYLHGISVEND